MTRDQAPIQREPRRVRPPYDVRDDRFEHLHATNTEAWRVAVRIDRLTALCEPLHGLEVTDYERGVLDWLAGWETSTVAVLAGLLHRARAAGPLAEQGAERPPVSP